TPPCERKGRTPPQHSDSRGRVGGTCADLQPPNGQCTRLAAGGKLQPSARAPRPTLPEDATESLLPSLPERAALATARSGQLRLRLRNSRHEYRRPTVPRA